MFLKSPKMTHMMREFCVLISHLVNLILTDMRCGHVENSVQSFKELRMVPIHFKCDSIFENPSKSRTWSKPKMNDRMKSFPTHLLVQLGMISPFQRARIGCEIILLFEISLEVAAPNPIQSKGYSTNVRTVQVDNRSSTIPQCYS